ILENHTDMASFRRDPPAAAGRQPSAYIDLTRIGCLETGDNSQRRGLAAPAGSQQAQDLAVPDGQIDAVQRRDGAESLADAAQLQSGHGMTSTASVILRVP